MCVVQICLFAVIVYELGHISALDLPFYGHSVGSLYYLSLSFFLFQKLNSSYWFQKLQSVLFQGYSILRNDSLSVVTLTTLYIILSLKFLKFGCIDFYPSMTAVLVMTALVGKFEMHVSSALISFNKFHHMSYKFHLDVAISSHTLLSGMTNLKELDLSRCSKITDAGVRHLLSLPALEKLWISETGVTADGVAVLSSLSNLLLLDLGNLPVTDSALKSLQVQYVSLSHFS